MKDTYKFTLQTPDCIDDLAAKESIMLAEKFIENVVIDKLYRSFGIKAELTKTKKGKMINDRR